MLYSFTGYKFSDYMLMVPSRSLLEMVEIGLRVRVLEVKVHNFKMKSAVFSKRVRGREYLYCIMAFHLVP